MTTNVQEEPMTETVESELITAEQVAARLIVPVSWVYAAARDGKFPCVRVGRYVRFRTADVNEYIATGGKGFES